jgi:histidinol-phosphate aminotransferase
VRIVKGYGFANGLRITVGRPDDVTRLLDTLAQFRATQ